MDPSGLQDCPAPCFSTTVFGTGIGGAAGGGDGRGTGGDIPEVPDGFDTPSGGGYSATGGYGSNEYVAAGIINAGLAALKLAQANLDNCKDLLAQVSSASTTHFTIADINRRASALSFFDGASSPTISDGSNFGAQIPVNQTVGQFFISTPGVIALSQANGNAVFVRSSVWASFTPITGALGLGIVSPPFQSASGPTTFAMATLLHEVLHKYGLEDIPLASVLGISEKDFASNSSQSITMKLLDKCW